LKRGKGGGIRQIMEAFQEKTGKSVVITGGVPKEGDDMYSATPEV